MGVELGGWREGFGWWWEGGELGRYVGWKLGLAGLIELRLRRRG